MKKLFVAVALATTSLAISPLLSAPAFAQAKSVAVADVRAAAARSNAFDVAAKQVETTYKAQIDQRDARAQTLQAELNVLVARYNEEVKKTPQNQATLQAAAKAVQDKRTAAQAELTRLSGPIDLALAYVEDQISVRMSEALKAAMTAKKVDLLLSPEAVIARENAADITSAVTTELNRILPNVSIAVPAGYQPGQLVQQANQAARAAAQAPQPAATAPASQPVTR